MNKNFPIFVLILLAIALSGCTGSESPKTTSVEVQRFDRTNQNLDAKIVDNKLEPDDVRAGEKVTAELFIANTGSEKIKNETIDIKAKVKTLDDSLANLYLITMSDEQKTRSINPIEFETDIEPGTVKTVTANFNTIKEMQGKSLAGTYEITITLSVNGQKIEARNFPVTLKSGTPREFMPVLTPSPTPTPIPTSTPATVPTTKIAKIATPTPTPKPTLYVAATPTGRNSTIYIKGGWYNQANLDIDAGDMVIFVNKDDSDYTLVEKDKKIPDMVLRLRTSYVFNTTGNYRIGLYFKPMRGEPRILAINVRHNESNANQ